MARITRRHALSGSSTAAFAAIPAVRATRHDGQSSPLYGVPCGRAKGIAEGGSLIVVDFASPTGVTVVPQLWGVAMAGTGWKENYESPAWRSAVRALNFQFVRQHLEGLLGSIFPFYNASPNWAAIAPFVKYVRAVFPNAQLQVGGAWFPDYMNGRNGNWRTASAQDINWAVSMWTQLANYLTAQGVTVTYWDGIFNEPDLQGLADTRDTTVSAAVVAAVSSAVFAALRQINPDWIFTGPCTAWWNPAYNAAINQAFPALAYNSFHHYNGAAPDWRNVITGQGVFYGNQPFPTDRRPGLINEYNQDVNGGGPNGSMQAAVWCAVQLMVGAATQNLAIGGYWQVSPDARFPGVTQDGIAYAPMHLLSCAGQHVIGTAVQCSNPGTSPRASVNVYTLACKRGSGFGILLTNYGSRAHSGRITLQNWPGNPTGNGTIEMWQQFGHDRAGTVAILKVERGVIPHITLPETSNTILYT